MNGIYSSFRVIKENVCSSFQKHPIIFIIPIAIFLRLYFFSGLIFSDDSYYNWLSFELINGSFNKDYIGYPIFLIRKLHLFFTSISFWGLGYGEIQSVFIPFLLSTYSVILIYKISNLLFNDKSISIIASFLFAFSPVDVTFASINFADLDCTFLINVGILFYIKAFKERKTKYSFLVGVFFFASMLVKEYAYFIFILLTAYFLYELILKRRIDLVAAIPILISAILIMIEGLLYYWNEGDFLYRLNIFKENFIYAYYDFFPYTLATDGISGMTYLRDVVIHISNNFKYIFIRKFYLLLPFIALYQSYKMVRTKQINLAVVWFLGLLIIMPIVSVSYTNYRPIEMRRVYYIYPMLFPFCILSAVLFSKLKPLIRYTVFILYAVCGIIMMSEFQKYFDEKNLSDFKKYIVYNVDKTIITDHHTAYGIRLIKHYKNNEKVRIFANQNNICAGENELIVYNKPSVEELRKQGFSFPNLKKSEGAGLKMVASFGQIYVYKKNDTSI